MSQKRAIRRQVKTALDNAIQQGVQPKAPRTGLGLVLAIPGARFRTPAGTYYYEKSGIPPPGKFDFQQDAVRKKRSQYITLLDGTQKK